jgi:sulfur-carrier protein adenylyltransferase/sulfurtransferase
MSTFDERYQRQITLPQLGENGQILLQNSSVLVVGAGGLGCPAIQYLAAAGIGQIHIVDFDTITPGNLNRQTLFNPADFGKNKAEIAAKKLLDFNPNIKVMAHPVYYNHENAVSLTKKCDVVLDCTDNPGARYLINDTCVQLNKPFVYAGIHRMEGQLAVFNFKGGATYRCVFPASPNTASANCEENGVLGTVPGILGTMQAQEAIKIIAIPNTIKNDELLVFNFMTNEITRIKTKRILTETEDYVNPDYINEIDSIQLMTELQSGKTFTFVDVREPHEPARPVEFSGISLPLSNWNTEYSIEQIPNDRPVIVFCQKGIRSEMAIAALPREKRQNLLNLRGGLSAWHYLKSTMKNERNEK